MASVEQNTIVESLVVVNWFSHVTPNLTKGEGAIENVCIQEAIERGDRRLPPQFKLQVTMAECSLDGKGRPRFRERLWAPDYELLRTRIERRIAMSRSYWHRRVSTGTVAF